MASRLKASEAAVLTKNRVNEIAVRAKQEEAEKREKFIQLKRWLRSWNAQMNKLIEAAIEGSMHFNSNSTLIGGKKLTEKNFSIYYVDAHRFRRRKEEEEFDRLEFNRTRKYKIESINFILRREIDVIVRLFKNDIRFDGMTITKINATRTLIEKIEEYKKNIIINQEYNIDELFNYIFDGQLYLFKPMESVRTNLRLFQKTLHEIANLSCDLDENEEEEEEEEEEEHDYYENQLFIDESGKQFIIPEEFIKKLSFNDQNYYTELRNIGDYFQIKWNEDIISGDWNFRDLSSAAALTWLASDYGQNFIEMIEIKIKESIHYGSSETYFCVIYEKVNSWMYDFGGSAALSGPSPRQLSRILKIMKYRVKFENKQKSNNLKGTKVIINW